MSRVVIDYISDFLKLIEEGKCPRISSEGHFFVHNRVISTIRKYLGLNDWLNASQAYTQILEKIESTPVHFSPSLVQPIDFLTFVQVGKRLVEKIDHMQSQKAKSVKMHLRRQIIALLYRLEDVNGGLSSEKVNQQQLQLLIEAAKKWKSSQIVFHNTTLSNHDIKCLRDVCQRRVFVNLLLSSPKPLIESFFKWTLRDGLEAKIFIEYPCVQKKICESDLNGRIAHMGGLKVMLKTLSTEDKTLQKIVTLPFEGKDISILDDSQSVHFRGNYSLTIQEVFAEFVKKRYGASNLEYMAEGIINWNAFLWGWWDDDLKNYRLVDLDLPNWWKHLPAFQTLSLKKARQLFGKQLDGSLWGVSAVASRERPTLDFVGTHAYSVLSMPVGNGRYAIYPFGKYAWKFPRTYLEGFLHLGEMSLATIAFPDENVFYTHRQHSSCTFALSEKLGLAYFKSVREDILLARKKDFVYQIESENCAKWVHQKLETLFGNRRLLNVFQMPFLHSEPEGMMKKVFSFVNTLPKKWHVTINCASHFILGAYKGLWIWEKGKRVWKALTHHSFWQDAIIYHPCMLLKQQEMKILGKTVCQGVTFTKQQILKSYHELVNKCPQFPVFIAKAGILRILRRLHLVICEIFSQGKKVPLLETQNPNIMRLA